MAASYTFQATGQAQFFTVQADGTYDIVAYGAGGGAAIGVIPGGYGAEVGGYVTLTQGEHLEIIVGSTGGDSAGGGGTFILGRGTGDGTGTGTYTPLLVAGGGGGAFNRGGGGGASSSGSLGNGGAAGAYGGGGGGAGVNGSGNGSLGGSNRTGAYAGGGNGGFGGGGGQGSAGGGGGGGASGGNGGSDGFGGSGGTSYDSGTPIAAQTVDAQNAGAGYAKITFVAVCYASGTLIRVLRAGAASDLAVEALQVGDLAITASGVARPIRWLGHRTLDCRAHAEPRDVWPIRVAAHALGDGLPSTDLFLSAGHSVRVKVMDEVLIPIGKLINGATIARHPVDEVTYWHVELDSHDVLIANGLPAESFLDCGNRFGLVEQEGDFERLAAPHTPADFCLPFVDTGSVVDAVRDRLAARATSLGWTATHDADLHLVVDGRRVDPDVVGPIARFIFPASAEHVTLASATQAPSDLADILDHRRLGVSIHGLELDDGLGDRVGIALGDDRLVAGWHEGEAEAGCPHRFTTGHLPLPPSLWAGCRGQVVMRVHHDPLGVTRRLAPAPTSRTSIKREKA